ncbi:MAG: DUF4404 family protein [Chthoniobacterales bacterium]
MIEDRIQHIQSTIQSASKISDETKSELLREVAALKSEIENLAKSHPDEAASITHFAGAATHEVARPGKDPQLAETALQGLGLSIRGLEESHPVLTGTVNRFATALSNMGL